MEAIDRLETLKILALCFASFAVGFNLCNVIWIFSHRRANAIIETVTLPMLTSRARIDIILENLAIRAIRKEVEL